jgi:cyanophycin synthetase
MMVQNAMAAAAAAHAAGAHLHDIRQGLRSFTTSIYQAPGRLNVFELNGVKVILDYAHNAAGLRTLGDFVDRVASDSAVPERPGEAARAANLVVGVVATAGDRRDEDMRELGRVAAQHFDDVIVREDRNPRGREPGETAALVAEGVREAMRTGPARAGTVEVIPDEMEAARKALDRARPGDVVVLCVDYATEVYKELEQRRGTATPAALRPSERGMIEAVGGDVDLIDLTSLPR